MQTAIAIADEEVHTTIGQDTMIGGDITGFVAPEALHGIAKLWGWRLFRIGSHGIWTVPLCGFRCAWVVYSGEESDFSFSFFWSWSMM